MTVLSLLRADLERQYKLCGTSKRANLARIFARCLHPKFLPLVIIRAAHLFEACRLTILAQIMAYSNILLFGIDVATKCEIGPGLFLPHTTGTVIGASRLGENVTVFQNVTLGAKYADMAWNIDIRPTVGNEVILGAGCKILGGIHIGNGAIVGANSVVLDDVPDLLIVAGIPAHLVKSRELTDIQEEIV